MKYLLIYDAQTGQIEQIMTPAPVGDIPREIIPPGKSAIRTAKRVDGDSFIVKGGRLRPRPKSEVEAREIAAAWGDLRTKRARILVSSDWTQVPDAPVDQEAWRAYRQALRDLPDTTVDPRNPNWPEPPK